MGKVCLEARLVVPAVVHSPLPELTKLYTISGVLTMWLTETYNRGRVREIDQVVGHVGGVMQVDVLCFGLHNDTNAL